MIIKSATVALSSISCRLGNRFGFALMLALSCSSFLILSCSQPLNLSKQGLTKATNVAVIQHANTPDQISPDHQNNFEKLKLIHHLPPAIAIDPLLIDIRDEDIVMAKALAKRNHQRSWKAIGLRSRFVRARLLATLNELHAPASLQVIPAVESTYDPYALSPAGALGLWQLMPKTARSLGVQTNKATNGRRHIADSTTAAVHYLKKMHQRFNSWPLAIAAYNMGPYAVQRRVNKQPWTAADGLENMPIPVRTRAYVQHVIGLIALLQDQTFTFPEPIPTRRLDLQAPVDIERLAQLGGMAKEDVFRLNPSLNQAQYLHQSISIHVPVSHYEAMHSKMALAGPIYAKKIIKAGDNLWDIARAHHTSVAMIKSLNKGMGKYLRIGQSLKVPANTLAQASSDHNPFLSNGHRIRYKVRAGDSLWLIANRFGTTPKAIARSNQISMYRIIRAGDTLWVFAKVRPS